MVFKSLTLLLAAPVHEEAIDVVDGGDGDQHIDDDSERGNSAEQTNQKYKATEEFGANCQSRQRRRNPHLLGKEPHRAVEAITSKPAQHLLRAVHKEGYAEHQAHDGEREVVRSENEFAKHGHPPQDYLAALSARPIELLDACCNT